MPSVSNGYTGRRAIAVDIGGTFTDLIAFDHETAALHQAKSLTTPRDLVQGILDCVDKSGLSLAGAEEIVHGTTIAINAVLEHRGVPTALIVTRGTRDVYAIGRGNRPHAYDLAFRRPTPLVPRSMTFEVSERMLSSGEVDTALDEEQVYAICEEIRKLDVEAIAVCFLHSYANPTHERRVGEILRSELPDVYVSLSHEILREFREYERTSTTVVNSYVGPVVSQYVRRLGDRLAARGFAGSLWIMQSNGGVTTPGVAAQRPVSILESGPVGGIIAAAEIGRQLGAENLIAFDMGGTTAKASLIREGTHTVANGYHVGGYAEGHPVLSPVVDVVEVGAGGGSIAWIDDVGALKVGPRSAGAEPGPICYGRGGLEPTITDANVALGRIRPGAFMGGEMPLDAEAARAGVRQRVAEPLGLSTVRAALGILDIAIAKMALAVREVSVAKGYDPRDFVLVASGGAGPLHAAAIARELHIPRVVIPRFPGHFSAVGMLLSDQKHDVVRTVFTRLDAADAPGLLAIQREMLDAAARLAKSDGDRSGLEFATFFDLRYAGQDFTLAVPVGEDELVSGDLAAVRARFDDVHQRRYGHSAPDERVELVNMRVTATLSRAKPQLSGPAPTGAPHGEQTDVNWSAADEPVATPVYKRDRLEPGFRFIGPALVEEYASTTVVLPTDTCVVADTHDLLITIGEEEI